MLARRVWLYPLPVVFAMLAVLILTDFRLVRLVLSDVAVIEVAERGASIALLPLLIAPALLDLRREDCGLLTTTG